MERLRRQCWLHVVISDKAIKVGGYDGVLGVGGDDDRVCFVGVGNSLSVCFVCIKP